MASGNRRKATFISQKLKFLKDQGDHLINDVGQYVSRIITAGESWIEGRDIQIEYQELNQVIDNAVEFLCEKCEELAGKSVDVADNQLSRPSCEQSNQPAESQPSFAKMGSGNRRKATFISQKLKFLKDQEDHLISDVGLYVSGLITAAESWIEGRDTQIEYHDLNQMIDNAVEFLCEKCEELAGTSVDVADNQLSQSSSEESTLTPQVITGTASSPATSYRQTAASLASTATTSYNQPAVFVQPADEAQVRTLLARIGVIEEAMFSLRSGIDQQQKELSKLSESDKKHSSRFRKVKEQISEISEAQDAMDQEHKTSLQKLERQVQKLCTAQDRLKDGMESQAELVEKFSPLPNQLESVKDNINALHSRIDIIIDDCSNKHEDIKTVMDNLAANVMANTQTVEVISERQDQKTTLFRELETRLQTLEAGGGRNVKHFQKRAEKGEANLRILCQMLSDRLTPIEQLRTSLNERASMRDDNIKKLSQVTQELKVMSPRLQQLELKASRSGCGFTASTLFTEFVTGKAITEYTIKYSTVGNKFNADSGIFTAPFDGLYVTSVSLTLSENKELYVGVRYQQNLSEVPTTVCQCTAELKGTNACCVGVVDLKVGDKLFLSMNGVPSSDNYIWVYFTCFLLR